jgi:uncharacterized protein YndB with AHSA1/START domain
MPEYAHTENVAAQPETVFAILDDTSRTPEWLSRCTGIDKLTDGPNRVGTKLRYHYQDGGRTGVMEGEITAHEPGRHLTMRYLDKMMDVTVDFRTEPQGTGTALTHGIDIQPKGFGKVFTPMIKRSLPKQTLDAMAKLKAIAES